MPAPFRLSLEWFDERGERLEVVSTMAYSLVEFLKGPHLRKMIRAMDLVTDPDSALRPDDPLDSRFRRPR